MKTIGLYYVLDNINEVVITPFIPSSNDLSAAIGFRDAYINNPEFKKKGIPYSALDLVRFAQVDVSEDGEYFINTENLRFNEILRIPGNKIMDFIKDKLIELGCDDNFVEEDKE